MIMHWTRILPALAALALPLTAQGQDTLRVDDDTVVIEIEDGRVTIDGRTVEDGGRVVVRTGPAGPFRFFHGDDPEAARFMAEFDPEVLRRHAERLQAEIAPMRERLERVYAPGVPFAGWMNPEVARLERETRELAEQVMAAEGRERTRLEQRLRERLDELFDVKLEARAERVERLEREADEARADLEQRRANREEIVDRRLRELLDDDVFDW